MKISIDAGVLTVPTQPSQYTPFEVTEKYVLAIENPIFNRVHKAFCPTYHKANINVTWIEIGYDTEPFTLEAADIWIHGEEGEDYTEGFPAELSGEEQAFLLDMLKRDWR